MIINFSDIELSIDESICINTELGKPTYEFEEQGTYRLGKFLREIQISSKVYHCSFLTTEQICDKLKLLSICEHKEILNEGETISLIDAGIKITWADYKKPFVELDLYVDNVIVGLNLDNYKPVVQDCCFDTGVWLQNLPWLNDRFWKNE